MQHNLTQNNIFLICVNLCANLCLADNIPNIPDKNRASAGSA